MIDDSNERELKEVFDTRDIDISIEQQNVEFLLGKLEKEKIDLNIEFQRPIDLWKDDKMSWLIEFLMVNFPVPGFYFDIFQRDNWQVVDGLQRLLALNKFYSSPINNKSSIKNLIHHS
jgi:hypothetical protein